MFRGVLCIGFIIQNLYVLVNGWILEFLNRTKVEWGKIIESIGITVVVVLLHRPLLTCVCADVLSINTTEL